MVNGVYIWFQPKRFPEAEGVLQINFFRYGLVRQDWASFGTLAGALRRWRTLEGAKLWINGKETGTVGSHNPQLTQIDRDTWRPGDVHVGGGGVVEAEGRRRLVRYAAVRHVPTGKIGKDVSHWDATEDLLKQGVLPGAKNLDELNNLPEEQADAFLDQLEDGWILDDGTFVLKDVGNGIIQAAGQIPPGREIHGSDVDYGIEESHGGGVVEAENPKSVFKQLPTGLKPADAVRLWRLQKQTDLPRRSYLFELAYGRHQLLFKLLRDQPYDLYFYHSAHGILDASEVEAATDDEAIEKAEVQASNYFYKEGFFKPSRPPMREAEGPREFFKSQLQAPAQLMRAAGLHVVEAPYKGEKGVTYSLRGTLYQLDWSWLVGYAERGNLSADLEIWFSQQVIESSVGEVAAIRNRLREACYWIKYITDNVKLRDTAHAIITSNLDKLESIQEIQEAEGPKEFFNHIHSWARILQGGGYTRKGANFVYRHKFPKFIVDSEVMPLPGGVVLFNVAIENKADELDFAVYAFSLGDAEMTKVAQEIPPIFAGWKAAAEHLEPRTASHAVNAKLTELFGKDRAEGSGDGSLAEAESPKRALKAAGTTAHAVRDMLRRAGFKLEERTLRYERWARQGHAHEPDTYWLAVRFVAYGEGAEQRWDLVKYSKRGNNALWSMEQTTTDSMLFRLKRLFFHPHTGEPFTND